ncbi:MAG TPA: TIGR03560 family F420-dependent LLM class oxidoreductase [Propionibacterium sp.]|nr:TIGR03560 family F420-dependent LLM class oxidoreductase [Propionibacterium sp.]
MQFGLDIAQQRVSFAEVIDRARFAESLGFTGVWGFDHFVAMYGEPPGEAFEGMTTLAALATATSKVRLGLMVTGVTYRHPSLFAHQANTIDHASNGRLEIGLGNGWYEAEHTQLGFDFLTTGKRFDLLEDQLEVLNRLMTGETVSYDGKRVSLQDARMYPPPVQRPRPPIWIGGAGPKRTLPLVARYADYWHAQPEPMKQRLDLLKELCDKEGRDVSSIKRVTSLSLDPDPDTIRRTVDQHMDDGIDYLYCGWPGEGRAAIERFADHVMAR